MSSVMQESIDRLTAAQTAYEQEDEKDRALIAVHEAEIAKIRDRIAGRMAPIADCKAAIAKLLNN